MNTATLPLAKKAPSLLIPALLACYLVWGSTYLAIRFALVSFPPFFQMGSRFLVAGALLMAWVRWRGGAWPTAVQWRNALAVGTLMLGGGMGLGGRRQQHIGSGLIATFIAVVPMMVCAWGLLFGQRPSGWNCWAWPSAWPAWCCWCAVPASRRHRWALPASPGPRWPGRWARCCPPRGCPWHRARGLCQRNVVWWRGVDADCSRTG
jgi:hypothetical protein